MNIVPMLAMLAAISGEAIVTSVVTLIVVAVVYWILDMIVARTVTDDMFKKVINVIMILGAGLFLIDAVLRLFGHPIINW